MSSALRKFGHWSYITLTFAQADWASPFDQYRAGVILWSKLRKRFTRRWGRFKYIQTWEKFQKGGAHVNVAVSNLNFFQALGEDWWKVRDGWLEPNAVACGFGKRTFTNQLYNADGMAGYLTKLSRELTGAGIKNQIPEDAPPHFRRLRASHNTLPPVIRSEFTGKMVFCPLDRWEKLSRPPSKSLTGEEGWCQEENKNKNKNSQKLEFTKTMARITIDKVLRLGERLKVRRKK